MIFKGYVYEQYMGCSAVCYCIIYTPLYMSRHLPVTFQEEMDNV